MKKIFRSLYNLGNAGIRSEIKRINQRIASLYKRFGADSEVYKEAIAPLLSKKYEKYIGSSNTGQVVTPTNKGKPGDQILKLNIDLRDPKVKEDPLIYDLIRQGQGSVRTIGELKQQAIRDIQSDKGEDYKPSAEEIDENMERLKYYQREMSEVIEFIYETYTTAEAQDKFEPIFRGHNGARPSYKELDRIIARTAKARNKWRKTSKIYEL